MSIDMRRNVRAALQAQVIVQGTDRWGKPFQMEGDSSNFSRRGMGLVLARDLVAPGSVVSVSIPKKFRSNAVVQWSRADEATGRVQLGLRLVDPKTSVGLKIAASFVLCLAVLAQSSFAKSRAFGRYQPAKACTMSLDGMRNALESALGNLAYVTQDEKSFLHVQHQQMTCEQYTQTYEKSDFYSDAKRRAAVSAWHWQTYHSKDATVRAAAIQSLETALEGNE